MRIALISDIHANLVALQSVLLAIDALAPDAIWCLGDVVGYGPEPEACVELVRKRAALCLAGNHDRAVTGQLSLDEFSEDASAAAAWHAAILSPDAQAWLAALPVRVEAEGLTLVHASPRLPEWEYVVDAGTAAANAAYFQTQVCLLGHSHVALAWRLPEGGWLRRARLVIPEPGVALDLGEDQRWLLNPGSVGQPRDRDPRASYALLDTAARACTWFRQAYDIANVDAAIRRAGLPPRLGQRLYHGQ